MITVPDQYAGQPMRCPICTQTFTAPSLDAASPLEALVTREPFSPDLALRVEMGQVFETLLAQGEVQEFINDFRSAFPVPLVPDRRIDVLFSVAASFQTELDLGETVPTALQQAFQNNRITLPSASIMATLVLVAETTKLKSK